MNLKFAVPGGRLLEKIRPFLEKASILVPIPASRELSIEKDGITFIFPRSADVPVFVENGTDLGICGSDTLAELINEVYTPVTLPVGICRMSIISHKNSIFSIGDMKGFTIATKYPKITQNFFREREIPVRIIKLAGSVELGCISNISDCIVDIVDSGRTIKENNLREVLKIMDIQSVLCVNKLSMKIKNREITEIINKIREVSYV
ncbi:MAG: ATP phosphoribosyltransferase [Petrotogaceae bacterium]|nr:ATP phosphoribosyltransferase [Petrotogaceae bacterium]